MCSRLILLVCLVATVQSNEVKVDIVDAAPGNAKVTSAHRYDSQVTLSIEADDGTLTPAGWSTRADQGGNGQPFSFTPGQGLIEGWTEGVLKMREGERAHLHVPSGKSFDNLCIVGYTNYKIDLINVAKGYGGSAQGSKGGAWYIPANSNLHFDIEIIGKNGNPAAKEEL